MSDNASGQAIASCRQCGISFAPKRSWQRFCTDRCRAAFHIKDKASGDLTRRVGAIEAQVGLIWKALAILQENKRDKGGLG
jgi:hypothetical protein